MKLNQHRSCAFALRSQSEMQYRTLKNSEFWASSCAVIYRCGLRKECKYYYDYRYNYCFPIFNRGKWVQQNSRLSYFFPELCVFNFFVKLAVYDQIKGVPLGTQHVICQVWISFCNLH